LGGNDATGENVDPATANVEGTWPVHEFRLPAVVNETTVVPGQPSLAEASMLSSMLARLSGLVLLVILVLAVIALVRSPPSALR
jgi:hypothetical protein